MIAHELGHGAARHSAEMISKTLIQNLAIDAFTDKESGFIKLSGSRLAAFVANLKYSRVQENEADRIALYFLNKAGFELNGAVTALNKFNASAGKNSAWKEWMSSHPHPEKRLENVKTAISQLRTDPEHSWGGTKDVLLEKAKVKAVEYYLKRKKTVGNSENKIPKTVCCPFFIP